MKTILVALLSLAIMPLCHAQSHKPVAQTTDMATALRLTPAQKTRLLELRKPILKRQYELDQEKSKLIASLSSIKDSSKRDALSKRLSAIEQEYTALIKKNKQAQDSVFTKEQRALVKAATLREHKK